MDAPSVDILLDVDREYRERTQAGSLPKVAPRRMNPDGKAWLPVLHTRLGPWHFTALFSNTERAHELDGAVVIACGAAFMLLLEAEKLLLRRFGFLEQPLSGTPAPESSRAG